MAGGALQQATGRCRRGSPRQIKRSKAWARSRKIGGSWRFSKMDRDGVQFLTDTMRKCFYFRQVKNGNFVGSRRIEEFEPRRLS
jgi:hypothetical protein